MANRDRARRRLMALGRTERSFSARSSASSARLTQTPSRSCRRSAISAAALRVKVRQRMRPGSTPASMSRSSRSVSSLVLPEPAEAATKVETAGLEAAIWWLLARIRASSALGVGGRGRAGCCTVVKRDHGPDGVRDCSIARRRRAVRTGRSARGGGRGCWGLSARLVPRCSILRRGCDRRHRI